MSVYFDQNRYIDVFMRVVDMRQFVSEGSMPDVPKSNQIILCHTSLWMMIPILSSTDDMFKFNLLLNMTFSMLHWNHFEQGSKYQFLDRMFSCMTLLYLTFRSTLVPLFPVVIFFLLGSYFWQSQLFGCHLFFHLLFRMSAFYWCCMYCNHFNHALWLLYFCLHALHILYLWLEVTVSTVKEV